MREFVEMLTEEELVDSRGHVLPEEGEPQNHLQEQTTQDIARPTGHQLRRVKDCKALPGEYVTAQHKPVVIEVRLTPRSRNQRCWTEEVAKAVGQRREALRVIHLYGQKKKEKAARRVADIAWRSMEEELYQKLDEDGCKKMTIIQNGTR